MGKEILRPKSGTGWTAGSGDIRTGRMENLALKRATIVCVGFPLGSHKIVLSNTYLSVSALLKQNQEITHSTSSSILLKINLLIFGGVPLISQ